MSYFLFDIYKLHDGLLKESEEYFKLVDGIKTIYEEEFYEVDELGVDISINIDEEAFITIFYKYLVHILNEEFMNAHDFNIKCIHPLLGAIKPYQAFIHYNNKFCFYFNKTLAEELGAESINDLINVLLDKIDVQDLINLINNNAVYINVFNYKEGTDIDIKSLYDYNGLDEVYKSELFDNSVYYEDKSYKNDEWANFKEFDYLWRSLKT